MEVSLGIEAQVPTFRTRASRWSHAVSMPVAARTVGRHPPSSIPGQQWEPGFDHVPTISTPRQRFTCVRLTSAHLTGDSRLFRNAHHQGNEAQAACGGLRPDPAIRARGANPHLLCSRMLQVGSTKSSQPPINIVVAHHCHRNSNCIKWTVTEIQVDRHRNSIKWTVTGIGIAIKWTVTGIPPEFILSGRVWRHCLELVSRTP